jgi:predicted RecB family nuclease
MQLIDGRPVFAATDLVGFLACEHLVGLELAALAGLVRRPERLDPEIELIAKRGDEHERRYLAELEGSGLRVARIAKDDGSRGRWADLEAAAEATRLAIQGGDDVVYQATFFDGRWLGYADFLLRVDRPSLLGAWSYEVADTKLARHVKASALLQICSYVEQLTRIQGIEPEHMHVALGGSARPLETVRVADYTAYYRMVKAAFEARVTAAGLGPAGEAGGASHLAGVAYPPAGTYPEPVEHCEVCRWSLMCQARRRSDDDLSLVAGAGTRLRQALKATGVATRRGLAALELPLPEPLSGVGAGVLEKARLQALIQVRGEDAGRTIYELLEPARRPDGALEPDRGLTSLPPPRPGDLFFDIEGDPFALGDGVDYLFGILEPSLLDEAGQPTFHAFWAIDEFGSVTPEAEKRAFEQTIDLLMDRLEKDPSIHIYHYAAYEPTAAGRLMGRHATREEEVDRLLRGGIFVDLFRAVRQGLRASVESYSIKKLEPLYGFEREVDLRDAGSSIVAFETWLAEIETGSGTARPSPQDDETLGRIAGYNRDDVVSNWRLRDWLEERRPELARLIGHAGELPRPEPASPEPGEELSARLAEIADLERLLCGDIPADAAARGPEEQGAWLLAQLLSWHRREEKSFWWRYYDLLDMTAEELVGEREPIGGLELVGPVGKGPRSVVYRYRFPEQEHAIEVGTEVRDPATRRSPGSVDAIDDAACTIDLRRGERTDGPHPHALVPCEYVGTQVLQDSLKAIGEWVAKNGIVAPSPEKGPGYEAARELLMRRPPRISGGEPLCRDGETPLGAALRVALRLDGSCLPVQGPPGSGKTYLGAEVAVELVRCGMKVGVTANSHKVIGHLLDWVAERAQDRGVPVRIGQKADAAGDCTSDHARKFRDNAALHLALERGELDVVGGTAWVWSRPEFAGGLDALLVDEAGQLSLANAIAVSPAARNLILLGDPQQLDQPLQGSHPPGAEASALGHVLGEHATMPPDMGLFLERTWRLHPDLCRFTSEAFYEGRLEPREGLEAQDLMARGVLSGTGVRFVPAAHEGNSNESPEEAELVAALVRELLAPGSTWTDDRRTARPLGPDDVLIVTPYNAQVAELQRLLPGARVGTVDKFQGQEAPVSIYSMATSSPEEAPRGMEFLYSLNRLNVATSRARCLAAVVASPALVRVRARTPRQMRLANALCRFIELAQ